MARSVRNRACTRHLHREASNSARHGDAVLRTRSTRTLLPSRCLTIFALRSLASTASAAQARRIAIRCRRSTPAKPLESRPEDQRTRRDYERVLDLYRAIYHDDPASPKADASIFAVAQLLAEQGRILKDEKSLHDAIGQYEFLRREYPGSRYRADALLAEGDIYFRDLNDNAAAKIDLSSLPQAISAQRRAPLRLAPASKNSMPTKSRRGIHPINQLPSRRAALPHPQLQQRRQPTTKNIRTPC